MQTGAQNGVHRLYHYQGANLDYLRDTLANQRVYFSNPKNFNDPWDCCPYFHAAVEDTESRRKWGERLDAAYKDLPAQLRAQLEARWHGNWYDDEEFLRRSVDSLSGRVRQLTIERWRIYCLTPHADSVLMWAHYAEKHQGICLEFDARTKQVGRAYRVLYQDTFPLIGPDDSVDPRVLVDAVLLTKSREWAYEDEYRILARDEDADPTFSLRTAKDYLQLTPGALAGIIAGSKANVAIEAVVAESGCDIPLRRAVRMPNRYHLGSVGRRPETQC
jgi:Protein of unknown function (DUF2971)